MSSSQTCAICGGIPTEHTADRQHAFTTTPGDLKTTAQAKQGQSPQQGTVMVMQPPPRDATDRLVLTLLEKQIITQDDALYITLGRRP